VNLRELIASFRKDGGDEAAGNLWDNATVTRLLNEAQDEACIRQKLIREKKDSSICRINVVADLSTYDLDPRVIDIAYASMTYAGNPNMFPYPIYKTTSDELDQYRPQWRVLKYRPQAIICYDTSIELDCIPDAAYTINLEVYRLPVVPMSAMDDEPEINAIHHRHLVPWALHRAYQMQDAETENAQRSEKFEAQFDLYFGKRPDANNRRRQNASRPHRNRAVF
jgi:hypothetical protein